jgi:serine/threonine protein kinase
MGSVYRGRHLDSGEVVAVKIMTADAANDPVLVKRFQQEFEAAHRLDHPHIVRGFEFGIDAGRPFLVMELVNGETLTELVKRKGALKAQEALRIITEVGAGLRLAHRVGLVHRDVKPDNILLARTGEAKLADLGLSKDLRAQTNLTKSRSCLGTVAYMAPEQFGDAKRVDARCDLYALAATLYFALTGLPPFRGRGNMTILKKKLDNDFVPLRGALPALAAMDEIVCRALQADVAKRPRTCDEFMAGLRLPAEVPEKAGRRPKEVAATPPADGPDKRAGTRYPAAIQAICRPARGQHVMAEIIDISQTGIRLEVERNFERGSVFAVSVCDESRNRVWSWRVEVRWTLMAGKRWMIGGKLSRPLTATELDVFANTTPTILVQPDTEMRDPAAANDDE